MAKKSSPLMSVGKVRVKDILPPVIHLDTAKPLRLLQQEALQVVRRKLTQTSFSRDAKKALAKALTIKTGSNRITVTAHHPAWKALIEGQKKGPSRWLTKSKTPIPIVTDTGKVIFRRATSKSMRDGKWVHPGRKPSSFIEDAREAAHDFLSEKLSENFRVQLLRGFKKR